VSPEGGAIAVRFAHAQDAGAVAHLDGETLAPVSPEEAMPAAPPAPPRSSPVRVVLEGGRFVVCFRRGNIESGYRLMAQAWTAGGSPIGEPVPISPPEADVYTAPQLVAVDGHRAIATFPASLDGRFELLAVPLEIM
jgi:hypothetical protein